MTETRIAARERERERESERGRQSEGERANLVCARESGSLSRRHAPPFRDALDPKLRGFARLHWVRVRLRRPTKG